MPKFSPELKFEPELLRTGPRFSSKFSAFVELDLKFSSGFSRIKEVKQEVCTGKCQHIILGEGGSTGP